MMQRLLIAGDPDEVQTVIDDFGDDKILSEFNDKAKDYSYSKLDGFQIDFEMEERKFDLLENLSEKYPVSFVLKSLDIENMEAGYFEYENGQLVFKEELTDEDIIKREALNDPFLSECLEFGGEI